MKAKGYRGRNVPKNRSKKQGVIIRLESGIKNPGQHLRRQVQKLTVTDLVYKYLRKVSYSDSARKQRNCAWNKFRRGNTRRRSIHPSRKYSNAETKVARCYVRKALSVAVQNGYLTPTDRAGRVLRLSSSLKLRLGDKRM
ncbi:uncharacterized protein LOC143374163 [Andrena cerasifolii]|uniref:uncharacterized protein LOC143374163 n=1 Tax=Andrena cerasifolii TaxID=2819439 RepID=UPI00403842D0